MFSSTHLTIVPIRAEGDIDMVDRAVQAAADRLGFGRSDTEQIATAASALAHNIVEHAGAGEVAIRHIRQRRRPGLELAFSDRGPGIPDVERAMAEGYSTKERPGMGLSRARAVMDHMRVRSRAGKGTYVLVRKWRGRR